MSNNTLPNSLQSTIKGKYTLEVKDIEIKSGYWAKFLWGKNKLNFDNQYGIALDKKGIDKTLRVKPKF